MTSNSQTATAVPYPDIGTLAPALQDAVASRRSLNVFRMLMHSPAQSASFLALSDSLRHDNSLPPPLRELAILRVCHVHGTAYAAHHHAKRARLEGLPETAIAAAREEAGAVPSAAEAAILAWTDVLLVDHRLPAGQREAFLVRYSLQQLEDFVFTVGFFQLVCNFLNTFEVQVEVEHA